MVALLRRFSDNQMNASDEQFVDDRQLRSQVVDYCMNQFGVSVEFMIVPDGSTAVEVSRVGNKFNFQSDDGGLYIFSSEDVAEKFAQQDQILLAAGAGISSTGQDNQQVCLEAIRFIRRHRPEIYAQFLFWQRAAELINQKEKSDVA